MLSVNSESPFLPPDPPTPPLLHSAASSNTDKAPLQHPAQGKQSLLSGNRCECRQPQSRLLPSRKHRLRDKDLLLAWLLSSFRVGSQPERSGNVLGQREGNLSNLSRSSLAGVGLTGFCAEYARYFRWHHSILRVAAVLAPQRVSILPAGAVVCAVWVALPSMVFGVSWPRQIP